MSEDFRPGDVLARTFNNGSKHRVMIVAGRDGNVRTSHGKVRYRSINANGDFTSGVQTAWWEPGSSSMWRLERP